MAARRPGMILKYHAQRPHDTFVPKSITGWLRRFCHGLQNVARYKHTSLRCCFGLVQDAGLTISECFASR